MSSGFSSDSAGIDVEAGIDEAHRGQLPGRGVGVELRDRREVLAVLVRGLRDHRDAGEIGRVVAPRDAVRVQSIEDGPVRRRELGDVRDARAHDPGRSSRDEEAPVG